MPLQKSVRRIFVMTAIIVIVLILYKPMEKNLNNHYNVLIDSINKNHQNLKQKMIRHSTVAGSWYPGDKRELINLLKNYFTFLQYKTKNTRIPRDKIKALIVPHAGFMYSGLVAAEGFAMLSKNYSRVIVSGTNHVDRVYYNGFSVGLYDEYETPIGNVKVSPLVQQLVKKDGFDFHEKAHKSHIIEVELPFLQYKLKNFEIIPLISGFMDESLLDKTAKELSKYVDDSTLIVISSDLSHYHSYDEAVSLDLDCIKAIENLDYDKAKECEACGIFSILTLLKIAKQNDWKAKIIDYKNSGDIVGEKNAVVGYSTIVFYEEPKATYSVSEKKALLRLAREKIESLFYDKVVDIKDIKKNPKFNENLGCFVTLNKNKNLRGCIGYIVGKAPLYECVLDNAYNAAFEDPRFNELNESELKDIEIEISILSKPKELSFSSPEELLAMLRPGIDGVIIKSGFYDATYLPQVWEQLPDKEEFLNSLCRKAGLDEDCWKSQGLNVFTYQAEVFSEESIDK